MLSTSTGGIGELANFLIGSAFVIPAGLLYKKKKNRKQAIVGMILGIVLMAIVAAFLNYFLLLPLYTAFMPMEQIIEVFHEFIPFIQTKLDICIFGAFPTTLLKGMAVSIITLFLYKKIRPILKSKN